MPGCCAKNCKNRSEHGFRMFLFPRDEKRRHLWAEKCGKNPTQNSRLCEYHFDDLQFENRREDGWRKLKPNAIPTIFESNEINSDILNDQSLIEHNIQPENCANLSNCDLSCNDNFGYNENVTTENLLNEQQTLSVPIAVHASVQTDNEINGQNLQTMFMTNEEGTIRQTNQIKYLLKQLKEERVKASTFKSKYENEKVLRFKTTKIMKKYKKRYTILSEKVEKSPIFKEFISRLSKRETNWTPQCLRLATQIRYAVGWKAYLYLKKDLGLPLPSYSTICRYIRKIDFQPGLLRNVFSLIAKKRESHKSSNQDDCVILMDEMDIQPALEYDVSTRSFVGQTTCDEIEKLSTSIVVFMLRGLNENWKQIVSWHLTSKSSNDDIMTQLLFEIVEEAEKIGYKVHGLVCDMDFFYYVLCRYIRIRQIIYINNEKTKIRLSKNKSFGSKSAHRQSII